MRSSIEPYVHQSIEILLASPAPTRHSEVTSAAQFEELWKSAPFEGGEFANELGL